MKKFLVWLFCLILLTQPVFAQSEKLIILNTNTGQITDTGTGQNAGAGERNSSDTTENTDNVNTQEETETVFEDNASKPEETTNESAVTQEPGNAPTPENPVYARAYQPHEQRESTKEEWYQEAQQEQKQQQSYNAYQFTAPESKKPNRSGKKLNGPLPG